MVHISRETPRRQKRDSRRSSGGATSRSSTVPLRFLSSPWIVSRPSSPRRLGFGARRTKSGANSFRTMGRAGEAFAVFGFTFLRTSTTAGSSAGSRQRLKRRFRDGCVRRVWPQSRPRGDFRLLGLSHWTSRRTFSPKFVNWLESRDPEPGRPLRGMRSSLLKGQAPIRDASMGAGRPPISTDGSAVGRAFRSRSSHSGPFASAPRSPPSAFP
jgi:hypothetical protein